MTNVASVKTIQANNRKEIFKLDSKVSILEQQLKEKLKLVENLEEINMRRDKT